MKASISSVIKGSDSRLDLGKLRMDDHGDIQIPYKYDIWFERRKPWLGDVRHNCKYARMPPLSPDMVARKLQEEKKFTNDSDVSKVASLYKRFFDAVSTSTETLEF